MKHRIDSASVRLLVDKDRVSSPYTITAGIRAGDGELCSAVIRGGESGHCRPVTSCHRLLFG